MNFELKKGLDKYKHIIGAHKNISDKRRPENFM